MLDAASAHDPDLIQNPLWTAPLSIPLSSAECTTLILAPRSSADVGSALGTAQTLCADTGAALEPFSFGGGAQLLMIAGIADSGEGAVCERRCLVSSGARLDSDGYETGVGIVSFDPGPRAWVSLDSLPKALLGAVADSDRDGFPEPVVLLGGGWTGVRRLAVLGTQDGRIDLIAQALEGDEMAGNGPWSALCGPDSGCVPALVVHFGPASDEHPGTGGVHLLATEVAHGTLRWSLPLPDGTNVGGMSPVRPRTPAAPPAVLVAATVPPESSPAVLEVDVDSGAVTRTWRVGEGGEEAALETAILGFARGPTPGGVAIAVASWRRASLTAGPRTCLSAWTWAGDSAEELWTVCRDRGTSMWFGLGPLQDISDVNDDGVDDILHRCLDVDPRTGGVGLCATSGATGEEVWRWQQADAAF